MNKYSHYKTDNGYIVRDRGNKVVAIITNGSLSNLGSDKKSVEDYCKAQKLC